MFDAPMILPEPLAAMVREYAATTCLDTDTALAVLITSGANTAPDDGPGRPQAVALAFAYGVQAERERTDTPPARPARRTRRGTARLSLVV